jgi:hypothetical protein
MVDRIEVYPQQILTDAEVLQTEKNALVGLGHLARAVLGTGPVVAGLACAPTSPASMSVTVGTGSIYALGTLDSTAYGSLGMDSSQIVKQGINSTVQTLACPAPVTTGQSIVYLIEAAYLDNDTNNAVLTYFNSTNPAMPFTGPGNTGSSQPTTRQGLCSIQVVAGTPATTGSQTTPAASSGYTGIYTVTVAYGATTIISGNISTLTAPTIPYTLPALGAIASNFRAGFSASQAFTSSGTWTVPSGITQCKVRVWGGGGGSGGVGASSNGSAGGGGAGGFSESIITGLTSGTAIAVTVGTSGGAGGAATGGGNGGTSSFGSYLSALGGYGGSPNPSGNGGGGGTASGGSLNVQGGSGGSGAPGSGVIGGTGGGSPFGGAGGGGGYSTGAPGVFPGGGAGGSGANAAVNGNVGGAGLVIVEW